VSTSQVVVLVVVVLVLLAAAAAAVALSRQRRRREALRGTFGPEYDRTVEQSGSRRDAERELEERQQRYASLQIRPLTAESRARYVQAWSHVQSRFVDEPVLALTEADSLVSRLLAERGFPSDATQEAEAMLSVEHRGVLDSFRAGHAVEERNSSASANTEDVRQGMLHFRNVFEGLMEDADAPAATTSGPQRDGGLRQEAAVPASGETAVQQDRVLDDRTGPVQQDRVLDDRTGPVQQDRALDDRTAPVQDREGGRLADGSPAVVVRDTTADGPGGIDRPREGGPLRPILPDDRGGDAGRQV
jgi:hypothetical protein